MHGVFQLKKAGEMLAVKTKLVLFMANHRTAFQRWLTNITMPHCKVEAHLSLDYLVRDLADEVKMQNQLSALTAPWKPSKTKNKFSEDYSSQR